VLQNGRLSYEENGPPRPGRRRLTRLRRDGYALSQGCKANNDHVFAYGRARELV
jgi:hypothetical protein